jgi:hypothetical protein
VYIVIIPPEVGEIRGNCKNIVDSGLQIRKNGV